MDHPAMSCAMLHVTPPWGCAARLHRPRAPEPMLGTWLADGGGYVPGDGDRTLPHAR